jgi:TolB-like protein/Flp pilus assembly protein TadD
MSLFTELKRRHVFKVGAAYLVVGWVVVEVASVALPAFEAPDWVLRVFILLVMLGLPLALVLAWIFDMTPEGVQVTEGSVGNRRFYSAVAVIAAVVLAWFFIKAPEEAAVPVAAPPPVEVAASTMPPSIAVLPFTDLSPGSDQAYFADGIAEEILNLLARNPSIRVVARTSAFQFREAADLREVGAALDATRIVEGSVRTAGTRVRITAQLIDAESGLHLWSETYDRELTDIFQVQDEIAGAIAEELGVRLGSGRQAAGVPDTDAYHTYLRGRKALNERDTPGRFAEGVALLERAIDLDPALANAHGALALAHALAPWFIDMPVAESLAQTLAASDTALELDPDNVEALIGRGYALAVRGLRVAEGERFLRRALELGPNDITAVNMMGDFARLTGDRAAAFDFETRAAALDPLESVHQTDLALLYRDDRNWEQALAHARRADSLAPLNARAPALEVAALAFLGELDAAQRVFDEAVAANRYLRNQEGDGCVLSFLSSDEVRVAACLRDIEEARRRGDISGLGLIAYSYFSGEFAAAVELIEASAGESGQWAFTPYAIDIYLGLVRAGYDVSLPAEYDELIARWMNSPWAERPPLHEELTRLRDQLARQ